MLLGGKGLTVHCTSIIQLMMIVRMVVHDV